jgi:hypothetical protein
MATKYFKKLNMANVISDKAGSPIMWEPIGDRDRTGVLALDDGKTDLIAALDEYADNRVGGVVRISLEIYDDLKKKEEPLTRFSPQSSRLRVAAQPDPFKKPEAKDAQSAAVEVAGKFQEPPTPSANNFFARTRRANAAQNPPQ